MTSLFVDLNQRGFDEVSIFRSRYEKKKFQFEMSEIKVLIIFQEHG